MRTIRTSMAARWDAGGAESSRPGNGSGRARPPRLVFGYGTLVSCPRSTLTYLGVLAPLAALRLLRNRNRLRSSARLASDAADLRPMSTYFWDRTLAADDVGVHAFHAVDDPVPAEGLVEAGAAGPARQRVDEGPPPGSRVLTHDRAVRSRANHLRGDAHVVGEHVESPRQHLEDRDPAALVVRRH